MATHPTEPTRPGDPAVVASARRALAGRADEPTIGKLVADATTQVSSLVRDEIALAKKEVAVDVKKGGMGLALFAGAAFMALLGLIFLLHTFAQLLIWLGLAAPGAYAIVTLVLFLVAAVLAFIGKGQISKVKGKPERTIETTKATIATVKGSAQG